MSWLAAHGDVECCDVTTIGRRTGNPHQIEIWFGIIDDTMYLISGNGAGADWYRNALVDAHVSVRLASEVHRGVARAVVDADERRRVGDLMGAKYGWDGDDSIGLTRHAWCYEVPVLAISEWDADG
ncbi:MAG TPA: nitroreductase/quinone reductase family protein [Ilumatobacteraceae bacterium]